MKHAALKTICLLILTAALCLLPGCADNTSGNDDSVLVVVEEGLGYRAECSAFSVNSGDDAVVVIALEDGFALSDCSFADYSVAPDENGNIVITLHRVIYPVRLKLTLGASQTSICYYSNGGEFIDGAGGDYRLIPADTQSHLRVNTSIGTDIIERSGYTQIGWNTQPDGSGEHVGLGSRVTPVDNGIVYLYAEWSEWTNTDYFIYSEENGTATITGTQGELPADELSIPASINGLKVKRIAAGAIENRANRLVLPATVTAIEEKAITGAPIEEIYFYDSLSSAKDSSFPNRIPIVHINAVLSPKYLGSNTNVQFAENLDSLILNSGKKKMIFFAGCSMCFGLRSDMVAEAFPDYTVLDMGVIGTIPASIQMEIISHYVESGDVFIHAPEERSQYQLMDSNEGDDRMFIIVEGNYDLLSLCDVSVINGFFESFCSFNTGRAHNPDCSYSDRLDCYNAYGDYSVERPMQEEDVSWHSNDIFDLSFVNENSTALLCDYYDLIGEKGAEVLFSFAPHNYNSLSGSCVGSKTWEVYEQRLRDALSARGYSVISHAGDYLYSGRYFYDTDYHLNDAGAAMRTRQLVKDLQKYYGNS